MIPLWALDLSLSDGGLQSGGQTGQWEWGTATVGPAGQVCWGTNLDGAYLHDTIDWVEVQLPDLSSTSRPMLVLDHWYAIRPGDGGTVEADGGAGFVTVIPSGGYPDSIGFTGSSGGWQESAFDLDGLGATPRVRLVLTADASLADAGWYVRGLALYDGDVTAPVVTAVTVPTDTQDLDGPYVVEVDAVDDSPLASVTLWTRVDGGLPAATPMTLAGTWAADIPAVPPGTVVAWWVEADDGTNVGRWPATGESSFRVYLAAPTGLSGPTGEHEVADRVRLEWQAPVSPHAVLSYRVDQEGSASATLASDPAAVVGLAPGDSQRFTVTALYAAGAGDPSEAVELEVEVPELRAVEPDGSFQGDELYVRVSGASLYLAQGAALDLGPDVTVTDVDVIDVETLVARVAISPAAREGAVPVTVEGARGRFSFPAAFSIRDGADAPRIRRITPDALRQGDEVEIEIEATVPFAAVPRVTSDDDLVVVSDVVLADDGEQAVAGRVARFSIAADTRARLGEHTLEVDDGARPYTVELRVDEYQAPVQKGCATGSGGWTAGALALGLARSRSRRRR